jgi:four helix bundle protein
MYRLPGKMFSGSISLAESASVCSGYVQVHSAVPERRIYILTSQFRRAAISIAANIAEGFKKRGKSDKARFMKIAQGSVEECRYYLYSAAILANSR